MTANTAGTNKRMKKDLLLSTITRAISIYESVRDADQPRGIENQYLSGHWARINVLI